MAVSERVDDRIGNNILCAEVRFDLPFDVTTPLKDYFP
jgi:hypothetical protein